VSDGLSGGVITTTGTISLNTGSVHFLDGVKKELNTEGVVSSSQQINTGSFTGSFIGTHSGSTFGTASFATTASYAVSASSADQFDGYVNFPAGLIVTGSVVVSGSVLSAVGGFTGSLTGSFTGVLGNKYTTLFGDGTANTFKITHNLNNTSVLTQIVREASGSFVYPDITISGSNAITLEFTTAPATNEYRANVYGF
jgi:hypothetical protein